MPAAAGAVTAAIAGLGGVREYDHRIVFRPRLPRELERLAFRVTFRGRRLRAEIRQEEASYTVVGDKPITIEHYGERLEIEPGADPVSLPIPPAPRLTRPRQPPGREPVNWHERIAAARGVSTPVPGAVTHL